MNTKHFREGEMVYLLKGVKHGKFDEEYEGPYEISQIDYNLHNAEIRRNNKKYVVHLDKLKRAREPINISEVQNPENLENN
jgi:hypothetical protein